MRALVTGAAGFVGRHLVAHLEAMGDTVVGVDRADGPDLLDATALADFVADVAPDGIYHLAGWSDVGASWQRAGCRLRGQRQRHPQPVAGVPEHPAPGPGHQQRRRLRPRLAG